MVDYLNDVDPMLSFFQIGEYMEHNDAILLVIVPAAQAPEISSSRALKMAKEYDPESGLSKAGLLHFLL